MSARQAEWDAIEVAEERGDWNECVKLCKDTLAITTDAADAKRLRLKLAYALLEAPRNQRENYEAAIALYNDLLAPLAQGSREWGKLNKNLGFAYQNRLAGERRENLQTAAGHYENALSTMNRAAEPVLYASISAEIGHILVECMSSAEENRERAARYLQIALDVFNPDEYPDEFKEVSEALSMLRQAP